MRVLWFTNSPCNYALDGRYNGGGWMSSLQEEIVKNKEIELGIAFEMQNQPSKVRLENTTYFPMSSDYHGSLRKKIRSILLSPQKKDCQNVRKYIKIIEEFKPDIIEIFGSESSFGLVAKYIKIPVVLHIQGILGPYYSAYLPPFLSIRDFYLKDGLWGVRKNYQSLKYFRHGANREVEIFKNINHFIGRTNWDKIVTYTLNSNAQYHYGGEILRKEFYLPGDRIIPSKLTIVSTISNPLYKGFDLVLKTAKILKNKFNLDFEWKVFGNVNPYFIENKIKIVHTDVDVQLMGVANAEKLRNNILNATCFVHPSYIDNSPNSICEAQILGCSVVSTNVGGIPSLIENGKSGFLIPSNDPYQLAYLINEIYKNPHLNTDLGDKAREIALSRHNKEKIVSELLNTYKFIIHNNTV